MLLLAWGPAASLIVQDCLLCGFADFHNPHPEGTQLSTIALEG
jgi:hypothetical protein